MSRYLRVLIAATVGLTTLLVAAPAEAADDTYVWVGDPAPQPDLFSDPNNWQRQSDGGAGVPGPLDDALIVDPADPIAITEDETVRSLVLEAVVDDILDLGIMQDQGGSLTAPAVTLSGDTLVDNLWTGTLHASGSMDIGSGVPNAGINLVASPDDVPGQLVLDGLITDDVITLDDGPVSVRVVGDGPSSVGGLVVLDSSLQLADDDGATFDGTVFATGDLELTGDVGSDAVVYADIDEEGPSTITWNGEWALLAGFLGQFGDGTLALPDELDITGELGVRGSATGGTVRVTAGAHVSFDLYDEPSGSAPALDLTGAFVAQSGLDLYSDRGGLPCVGTEDVLVRAADGVTAHGIGVAGEPAQLDSELVPLRNQWVAVLRATTAPPEGCEAGADEAVVRAMYRDLLGRVADASGAGFWAGKLGGGTSAVSVASQLLATSSARVELVRATFDVWACTGEVPSEDAVAFGAEYLRAGGGLTVLRADVLAGSIGDDVDPVECIYSAVLGRNPDPGGRAYVEGRLESESVQKVARKLMFSSEGRRVQFNRLYQHLLGRDATSSEVAARLHQVGQGRTEAWITAQIAGSTEYVERAAG